MSRTHYTRREFLGGAAAGAMALSAASWPAQRVDAEQNAKRPNFIFCMTDDQGYGDVGYMGHPVLKTPELDEMAATGLRMDRFYSASPVCSPTRASALTGRHPNRMGVFRHGHALRPQERTVAEILRDEAGYRTGFFGKWHLGSVREDGETSPGAHGFDEWYAAPNFYTNDPWMSHNGQPVQLMGEGSAVTAEAALHFFEEASADGAPFVAFVWFGSPHTPHEATEELQALYADQPENLRNYYGEITGVDRAMGMIRKKLRELGVENNTVLWFTSDNGGRLDEADNAGLRGEKGQVWEGGIRVPCVLEWPSHIEHRVTEFPGGTVDLLPTFLDLANVAIPEDRPLDGVSLAPLMRGGESPRPKPLGFWHYEGISGQIMRSDEIVQDLKAKLEGAEDIEINDGRLFPPDEPYDELDARPGHAAWIDCDWKLHRRDEGNYELYNLADDHAEQDNVIDANPDRAARMRAELRQWQESVLASLRGADYE